MLLLPLTAIAQPGEPPLPEPVAVDFSTIAPEPEFSRSVLCNCYALVKSVFSTLPSMKEVIANVTATGSVAVFYYADSGLYHLAVVRKEVNGRYFIEETNYSRCKHGFRWIDKDDPALLGFFIPR